MLFDFPVSEAGRATHKNLDALRKQLDIGCDPVYDYTQMEEDRKALGRKDDKKAKPPADQPDAGANSVQTGLEQLGRALKKALREAAGGAAGPEELEKEQEGGEESDDAEPSPQEVRALREASRNTSSFKARSRDSIAAMDVTNKYRAPPVGTYRPKEDCILKKVQNTDFGYKEPNRSRHAIALEQEVLALQAAKKPVDHLTKKAVQVELLDEKPERVRPRQIGFDLKKTLPRPDIIKQAGITFNINSFTAGVLDGDRNCSHIPRQPVHDFAKTSTAKPKPNTTYFQPGQYNVKLGAVRPSMDTKNIPFEMQRARKPPKETVGRFEIDCREGDHLPDRSLSRSCPLLSKFGVVKVPEIKKYTKRPPIVKPNAGEYHKKEDPSIDQVVLHKAMTFDISEAMQPTYRKTKVVENFDKSLTREQHAKISRAYGQDMFRKLTRENLTEGPRSVERLTDVDVKPSLQPRVKVRDFARMPQREVCKDYAEQPARNKSFEGADNFERIVRDGDARTDTSLLSPLSQGIADRRRVRSFDALAKANELVAGGDVNY